MKNYSSLTCLLRGICFLTILRGITCDCNTLKLGPNDPLTLSVFDNQNEFTPDMFEYMCKAVKQFPQGLITVDYRAGASATGSADNIQCGGGNCKEDLFNECVFLNSPNYNDCFSDIIVDFPKMLRCYCKQDASVNALLLKNSEFRASLNIPDTAVPTLALNYTYDSCVKFGSYQDILDYLCQVYQKKVGNCG